MASSGPTAYYQAQGGGNVQFRILGPVEVAVDGEPIDLGPRKQRSLFALLLIHHNRVVSSDRILRLVAWDREASSVMRTSIPSCSTRRSRIGSSNARDFSILNLSSARVELLLACWPPGTAGWPEPPPQFRGRDVESCHLLCRSVGCRPHSLRSRTLGSFLV